MHYPGGIAASLGLLVLLVSAINFAKLDIPHARSTRGKYGASFAVFAFTIAILSIPLAAYLIWRALLLDLGLVYAWMLLPIALIILAHMLTGDMATDPRTGRPRRMLPFIKPVCLFSSISGRLLLNGLPVSGARLIRSVNPCRSKSDETTTNAHGYFHFKALFGYPITAYLPQEYATTQQIQVVHQGTRYTLWSGAKRDTEENSEARGQLLKVTCELSREETLKKVNGNWLFSLCTWDAQADPEYDFDKGLIENGQGGKKESADN